MWGVAGLSMRGVPMYLLNSWIYRVSEQQWHLMSGQSHALQRRGAAPLAQACATKGTVLSVGPPDQ